MQSLTLRQILSPLWAGDVVYDETVMLLTDRQGVLPTISLLCPAEQILSVFDYSLNKKYAENRDFALSPSGCIAVPANSALYETACRYDKYYQESYIPEVNRPMLGGGAQIRTEASRTSGGLTEFQIRVTYRRRNIFPDVIPPDKQSLLPRTSGRMIGGEECTIALLGDSISAGWSASGFVGREPHQPPYFTLFTEAVRRRCSVREYNFSVGGKTSVWGREKAQTDALAAVSPDLAIIAFGMNDGAIERLTGEVFRDNIAAIIRAVRSRCAHTEFILVSPMLPNAELCYEEGVSVLRHHAKYPAELAKLESEFAGVAVADVTSVHRALLCRKAYRDMSSNNINHPNDFMHRVYAQVLLRTLFGNSF